MDSMGTRGPIFQEENRYSSRPSQYSRFRPLQVFGVLSRNVSPFPRDSSPTKYYPEDWKGVMCRIPRRRALLVVSGTPQQVLGLRDILTTPNPCFIGVLVKE